jgi:hypothetical protein
MDTTGGMGAIKQMWLNKGKVVTIIPFEVLEQIWPVMYNSRHVGGLFVIHTNHGDIFVRNNRKEICCFLISPNCRLMLYCPLYRR